MGLTQAKKERFILLAQGLGTEARVEALDFTQIHEMVDWAALVSLLRFRLDHPVGWFFLGWMLLRDQAFRTNLM